MHRSALALGSLSLAVVVGFCVHYIVQKEDSPPPLPITDNSQSPEDEASRMPNLPGSEDNEFEQRITQLEPLLPGDPTPRVAPPVPEPELTISSIQDVSPDIFQDELAGFVEPLEPHGQWLDSETHGPIWQPDVVDDDPDWRPYTNGAWADSEYGWVWDESDEEPWGWATYHYGRWVQLNQWGWCWVPGREWAPAWVSWRSSDTHVGWAPLSPAAHWHDTGFASSGELICELGPNDYNFIGIHHFAHHNYRQHLIHHRREIFDRSESMPDLRPRPANQSGRPNVVNTGVSVDRIREACGDVHRAALEFDRVGGSESERQRIKANLIRCRIASVGAASHIRPKLGKVASSQQPVPAVADLPKPKPVALVKPQPRVENTRSLPIKREQERRLEQLRVQKDQNERLIAQESQRRAELLQKQEAEKARLLMLKRTEEAQARKAIELRQRQKEEARVLALKRARADEARQADAIRAQQEEKARQLGIQKRRAEEARRADELRKKAEESRRIKEERDRKEQDRRRKAEQQRRSQEAKQKADEARRRSEEQARRAAEQRQKAEEQRRAEEAKQRAEDARRKNEEKARRAAAERQKAERARQKAEEARRRSEAKAREATARKRAEERARQLEERRRRAAEAAEKQRRAEAARRAAEAARKGKKK